MCVCEYILHHRHVSPNRAAERIWSSIQCIERKKIFVLQMHLSLRLIGLLACLLLWLDFFFAVDSSSLFYREAQIEASISHEKTRHNNVYDNFRYVQSRNALQIDLNPFSVSVWGCVCACLCLSFPRIASHFSQFVSAVHIYSVLLSKFQELFRYRMYAAVPFITHTLTLSYLLIQAFLLNGILSKRIDRTIRSQWQKRPKR